MVITTRIFRMSLIAGGTAAVTTIGGAITGTIALIKKIDNKHNQEMALISNRHQESMKKLEKEQNDQNNRHKEFMKLLDTFNALIGRLGDIILNAECEGCKGLPGIFHYIFQNINCFQRWSVDLVRKKLWNITTIISIIYKCSRHNCKNN